MFEPLSASASALGIISLGLQVCQGMITYYEDWRSFNTTLSGTENEIQDLLDSLRSLHAVLDRLSSIDIGTVPQVHASLRSCEEGVKLLNSRLKTYRSIQVPQNFKEKVKFLTQRSLYPLRKASVQEVKATAVSLQVTLNTALQALQADLLVDVRQHVKRLEALAIEGSTANSERKHSLVALRESVETPVEPLPRTYRSDEAADVSLMPMREITEPSVELLLDLKHQCDAIEARQQEEKAITELILRNNAESMLEIQRILPALTVDLASITNAQQAFRSGLETQSHLIQTQIKHQEEAVRSFNRLLNKPSLFRSTMDEMTSMNRRNTRGANFCTCVRRASVTTGLKRTRKIGPITLASGSQHQESCRFCTQISENRSVSMSVFCLSYLVEFSMSITFGAGGLAISPALMVRGIVTHDSPAFGLITSLWCKIMSGRSMGHDMRIETMFAGALDQLRIYFAQGRSHPTQTQADGKTLLHAFPIYMRFLRANEYKSLSRVILQIAELGVPLNEVTSDGRSMLDLLSAFQSNIEKWEVIEDLVAAGAVFSKPGFHELDSDDLSDSGDSDYSDESDESSHSFRLCDSFDSLPLIARPYESEAALEYAEYLECGRLSQAIIYRSEDDLSHCLETHPHTVNERNAINQTPLHLAVRWPLGVGRLLAAGADPNLSDNHHKFPVDYARRIDELDSAKMLYEANSCAPCWGRIATRQMSEAMLQISLSALAQRRRALLGIALQNLPQIAINDLKLEEGRVLDAQAQNVLDVLRAHSVTVPKSVELSVWDKWPIYAFVNGESLAVLNSCYEHGFWDLDGPLDRDEPSIVSKWELSVSKWFMQKGANIDQPADERRAPPLHDVISRLVLQTTKSCYDGTEVAEKCQEFLGRFLWNEHRDNCVCGCGDDGCNSVLVALKCIFSVTMLLKNHKEKQTRPEPSDPASFFWAAVVSFARALPADSDQDGEDPSHLGNTIIRFMTFTALDLTHTCCRPQYRLYRNGRLDEDLRELKLAEDDMDVHEIQDEERETLQDLDNIVKQLTDKQHELNLDVAELLEHHWKKQIQEYYEQKPKPGPDYRDNVRAVGVILGNENVVPQVSCIGRSSRNFGGENSRLCAYSN